MSRSRQFEGVALACVVIGVIGLASGYARAQTDPHMETSVAVNAQRIVEHDRRIAGLEVKMDKLDWMLYGLFANLGASGFQIASQIKRGR
jgi:hypothetical protein